MKAISRLSLPGWLPPPVLGCDTLCLLNSLFACFSSQGVMKAINVNKLTKAGCHFKFWVADWFAQLNNKMGGDLKKIQVRGKEGENVDG